MRAGFDPDEQSWVSLFPAVGRAMQPPDGKRRELVRNGFSPGRKPLENRTFYRWKLRRLRVAKADRE